MKMKLRGTASLATTIISCTLCFFVGYYKGAGIKAAKQEQQHIRPVVTGLEELPIPLAKQTAQDAAIPSGSAYYAPGVTIFNKKSKAEPVCLNTCPQAKNGVCNDGRKGTNSPQDTGRRVTCDLGTDCADCGPWTPSGHAPWITDNVPGPIARLMKAQVEVRVRTSVTQPGFEFAYTDPVKDVDVSRHLHEYGSVEPSITQIFGQIFKHGCKAGGKQALFVDVGANFGWFSVLAAAMGCRIVAFEPVPLFAAFFEYSVHLNGFAQAVDMRGNVVSHVAGSSLKMVVPSQGIWGTAGIGGLNIDRAITASNNIEIHVPSQKLDDLIKQDVLLMKVDVEGWEWSVMQGAAQLFAKHNVQNVIMEYSPGVPERNHMANAMQATVQMLLNIADAGYRIAELGHPPRDLGGNALPEYREVTGHNLLYDLVDSELFKYNQVGCPKPDALTKFPAWFGCNSLPEGASPRSFRGNLGHNTNIWASKGSPDLQKLGKPIGIIGLDQPYSSFFVPAGSTYGMGMRICKDLSPQVQVYHRCPCVNKAACGEEEAVVTAVTNSSAGIVSNYVLAADGTLVSGTGFVADLFKKIKSAREIGKAYLPGAVTGLLSESTRDPAPVA